MTDELGRLVRVRSAEPLDGFRVRLQFEDGMQREVDLAHFLCGPVFEPIRQDNMLFRTVKVAGGTLA